MSQELINKLPVKQYAFEVFQHKETQAWFAVCHNPAIFVVQANPVFMLAEALQAKIKIESTNTEIKVEEVVDANNFNKDNDFERHFKLDFVL